MSEKEIMDKLKDIEENQKKSERVTSFGFAITGMVIGSNFFAGAATCETKWAAGALILISFGLLIYSMTQVPRRKKS